MNNESLKAVNDTAKAFIQFNALKNSRKPVTSKVSVTTLEPGSGTRNILLQEGTMTIVHAKKSSGLIAQLKDSVEKKDLATAQEILSGLLDKQVKFMVNTPSGFKLDEIDAATELKYMNKTVAEFFIPSAADGFVTTTAYNGGKMDASRFEIIEHKANGSASDTETLLIFNQPQLTKFEEEILAKVGNEDSRYHLSEEPPEFCTTTTVAVAGVAAMFYVGWDMMTQAAASRSDRLMSRDINKLHQMNEAGQLDKLDPKSAAMELVRIRTRILGDKLETAS